MAEANDMTKDDEISMLRSRLEKLEKKDSGEVVATTCNSCGGAPNEKGVCPNHPGEFMNQVDAKDRIVRQARSR